MAQIIGWIAIRHHGGSNDLPAVFQTGEPLMEFYADPRTGRRHERRRRGLSNSSSREGLDAAERVLRHAGRTFG